MGWRRGRGCKKETPASEMLTLFVHQNPSLPRQPSTAWVSNFLSNFPFFCRGGGASISLFEKWRWSHLSFLSPSPETLIRSISVRFSVSDRKWGQFEKSTTMRCSLKYNTILKKQRRYHCNQMFFLMMEAFPLKPSALLSPCPTSDRKWHPLSESYITSEARGMEKS